MRDLHLSRTIPLVGLGAVLLVGCGARSIDEPGGAGASDPLSDDEFEDTLLDSFEDYCLKLERCGYSDYDDPLECAEYYVDSFPPAIDLDSRGCRQRAIDAVDCLADQRSCDDSSDECAPQIYDLLENCSDYSEYYDY